MKSLAKSLWTILFLCAAMTIASHAQTFKTLHQFDGFDGGQGLTGLVQGPNGNLFGSTEINGKNNVGTLFEIGQLGGMTDIYDFCPQTGCSDGANPNAALLLASDGNLYGTTNGGGANGKGGTIFKITPSGHVVTIYSFCSMANCADGSGPTTLVQGHNGHLYGITGGGGTGVYCPPGTPGLCGTAFDVTVTGQLTTLYNFCSLPGCRDGYDANSLTLGTDGNFYGTGLQGGYKNYGTAFVISPFGKLAVLHEFTNKSDGFVPNKLVQGNDGNFYGTSAFGGSGGGDGVFFQLTPKGVFTALYGFCAKPCPTTPNSIIVGSDGNFYGTSSRGGTYNNCESGFGLGCGTVFQLTPGGVLTTIYNFCPEFTCPDGSSPYAPLVQNTNGTFYGVTYSGGSPQRGDIWGTLFSLSTGLASFVSPNPTFGRVGLKVMVLGNNLTGATNVSFNRVPATFTVLADTLIKATVPSGATTGSIQVTTPTGTLNSNVAFQILP